MTARRPAPDTFLPLTPVAFEILLALAEDPRHGYDIMLEIERRTAGRVSLNPGTLYRALDRRSARRSPPPRPRGSTTRSVRRAR